MRWNGVLRSHVIDPTLLRSDAFETFYAARKAALLGLVERAIGKVSADVTTAIADDDDDDDDE